jgi:S-adenosylmethionine hydrolase
VTLVADPFGNVVTSIRSGDLAVTAVAEVEVAGRKARFVRTYGEGDRGELLALVGSGGRLEIVVREGSAARLLGAGKGTPVRIALSHPPDA